MTAAESWRAPDWFTSQGEESELRVVLVDGTASDAALLLRVVRGAGIECRWDHWSAASGGSTGLLFEPREAVSAAVQCLRALRADPRFADVPALCALSTAQLAQLAPTTAFDDFVLQPCTPLEVRARIRTIEQRRLPAPREPVLDGAGAADGIQIDPVSHEAVVDGRTIRLTAREFALFAYLRASRGRVLSRQQLLQHVWGHRYRGGPRTVDTHIGRLRLKFGRALPIETLRRNGYRLGDGTVAVAALEPPSADREARSAHAECVARAASDSAAE